MNTKEPGHHDSMPHQMESVLPGGITPKSIEVFLIDEDGVLTASKGFDLASFGSKPGPASGLSVFDLFSDEPALLENIKRALNGEPVNT